MKFYLVCLFILSLINLNANADSGHEVGNGGDGVLLNGKVYVLDLVEAGVQKAPFFNPNVTVDPNILTRVKTALRDISFPHALIAQKLTEIAKIDVKLAFLLLRALEMYTWSIVAPELVNVSDENTLIDVGVHRKNLVQLAIRRRKSILISSAQWQKLDGVNRVGLIFHEAVYAVTTPESRNQDSAKARALAGFLFTSRLSGEASRDLLEQTKEAIPSYEPSDEKNLEKSKEGDILFRTPRLYLHLKGGWRTGSPFARTLTFHYGSEYQFLKLRDMTDGRSADFSAICEKLEHGLEGTLDAGDRKSELFLSVKKRDPITVVFSNFLKGNTEELFLDFKEETREQFNFDKVVLSKNDLGLFRRSCTEQLIENIANHVAEVQAIFDAHEQNASEMPF